MKIRITQANELRGLLGEFGIVLPEGHRAPPKDLPAALERASAMLPRISIDSLHEQVRRITSFEAEIAAIERRLSQELSENVTCQTLAEIPGVGLLKATAIAASVGSASTFSEVCEFSAWIGFVLRQIGTGGRVRQLEISTRGGCLPPNATDTRC
jgi:transposase